MFQKIIQDKKNLPPFTNYHVNLALKDYYLYYLAIRKNEN